MSTAHIHSGLPQFPTLPPFPSSPLPSSCHTFFPPSLPWFYPPEMEPGVLGLLGKHSITEIQPVLWTFLPFPYCIQATVYKTFIAVSKGLLPCRFIQKLNDALYKVKTFPLLSSLVVIIMNFEVLQMSFIIYQTDCMCGFLFRLPMLYHPYSPKVNSSGP